MSLTTRVLAEILAMLPSQTEGKKTWTSRYSPGNVVRLPCTSVHICNHSWPLGAVCQCTCYRAWHGSLEIALK
jgi:hypothetical protein